MEEIIQKAILNCSLDYVNGNENLVDVWDQSFTMDKKVKDLSKMLTAMGYELKKKSLAPSTAPSCNDRIRELSDRLSDGRHYLMSVSADEITVEDALDAFGFGRNGLKF